MKLSGALFLAIVLGTRAWGGEQVDLQVVHRLKGEAFSNSKVMDHLFFLTDANGPRLTGSPGLEKAMAWAITELKKYGIENAHLESWGPFGLGWSFSHFEIQLTQPTYTPLRGVPMAWCGSTPGKVHGAVLATPLLHEDEDSGSLDLETLRERIEEYKERWKDKLAGKIVLLGRLRDFAQATEAASQRLDDKALGNVTEQGELKPTPPPGWVPDRLSRDPRKRELQFRGLPLTMLAEYWDRRRAALDPLNDFFREQGVAAVLRTDKRGAGGLVFCEAAGSFKAGAPLAPPTVALAPEQFNRLWRLVEHGIPTEVELDLATAFIEAPRSANVIAEIPGTTKRDEIVMLGAHLDSWHAGTGATDNAVGCAVVLEAFRILKQLDLKMARTVRLALWSGEEQGLYGSRAYVQEHFGDSLSMSTKPEHAKLCAYFNLDNGSGRIRGIHLQGNDMARPIFEGWFAPFKDLGAGTITIRETGGTDHLSFDEVGLPGFQFLQDPLDYGTRTHHSELDVYDHAEPGDLMQAAAIMASFVYDAAMRQEMLPRKPLPPPLPPKPPGGEFK